MSASQLVDPTAGPTSPPSPEAVDSAGAYVPRLIHFLEDGFTAFSQTWYRGQELEITEAMFAETIDTEGTSWLDALTKAEQYKRFGKLMFDEGPWPYEAWEDDTAKQQEMLRRRRPVPPGSVDRSQVGRVPHTT